MKNLGAKLVKFAAIQLPGDWQERIGSDRVRELAADLDKTPLLQRSGIRKGDRAVIFGRDRLAAQFLRNPDRVEVDVWECTDEELQRAELVENAFRRSADVDARRKLVDKIEAEVAAGIFVDPIIYETGVPENEPRRGRPKSPKTVAREVVAARAGVTVGALKKEEQRAAAKAKEEEREAQIDADIAKAAGDDTKAELEAIGALLVQVKKRLTQLTLADPHLIARFPVQTAKTHLNDASTILRGMAPKAPCPYHEPLAFGNCAFCHESGWVTADQLIDLPPEMKPKAVESKSQRRKALQIQDADGNPIPTE